MVAAPSSSVGTSRPSIVRESRVQIGEGQRLSARHPVATVAIPQSQRPVTGRFPSQKSFNFSSRCTTLWLPEWIIHVFKVESIKAEMSARGTPRRRGDIDSGTASV
jgi:hypothetical protein